MIWFIIFNNLYSNNAYFNETKRYYDTHLKRYNFILMYTGIQEYMQSELHLCSFVGKKKDVNKKLDVLCSLELLVDDLRCIVHCLIINVSSDT